METNIEIEIDVGRGQFVSVVDIVEKNEATLVDIKDGEGRNYVGDLSYKICLNVKNDLEEENLNIYFSTYPSWFLNHDKEINEDIPSGWCIPKKYIFFRCEWQDGVDDDFGKLLNFICNHGDVEHLMDLDNKINDLLVAKYEMKLDKYFHI